MGNCIIDRARIVLSDQTELNDKYSNWVYQTASNTAIGDLIINAINSGKFVEHFKDDEDFKKAIKDGFFKINGNTFKRFIRLYEQSVLPSVTSSVKSGQGENKSGFDSADTRKFALNYTGDLMIDVYNKLAYKRGTTKLRGAGAANFVKETVRQRIISELVNRVTVSCDINEHPKLKNAIEEYYKIYATANKAFSANKRKIAEAKTNKEIETLLAKEKQILASKQAALEQILGIATQVFKNNLDELKNQNYLALATVVTNGNTWFDEVANIPKIFEIRDLFVPRKEGDKVNDTKEYDDYNLESILSEDDIISIDASTANWNDALYNNFIQHFDGRIKLYLNTLLKLDDDGVNYKTDNKLGVPETMGAGYIISQLTTFGKFTSVNDFIQSVKDIAENIPGLAGLKKLAEDMENNRSFANMVASNLAKPAIVKNMIIFDGEAFKIIHSNQNAYASTQIFNRLMSVGKMTLSQEFDPEVNNSIDTFLKDISKLNEKDFISTRTEIGNFILNYFKKNFPGINPDVIAEYYYTTKEGEKIKRAKELLNIIKEYNNKIETVKRDINKEATRVSSINKAFKEKLAADIGAPDTKGIALSLNQREEFNPDAVNYKLLEAPIAKLSVILSKHMASTVDLNSGNAENNMSSDIIKNSYLTNFLAQLNDILENPDGTENQRGLQLLKDFYGKVGENKQHRHFDYSPILYGIKSGNKYIREGLFIKQPNGTITINPNAKELINIILFNGIKNTNLKIGQLYQNMSRSDYFASIITSYFQPLDYNHTYKNKISDYCQILLRIPSDASNQYAVQMPKYRFDDFYKYDENATKQFISASLIEPYISLKGIAEDFTKKVRNNLNNEGKLAVLFNKKKANFIGANEAAIILNNGGISGTINNIPYKKLNEGKVIPLVVQDKTGNNSFIIYLKSEEATYKSGKDYKIASVAALDSTKQKVYDSLLMETETVLTPKDVSESIFNYFSNNIDVVNELAFTLGKTKRNYNKESAIYLGFIAHIKNDINRMFNAIDDVFEEVTDENGIIHYVTKQNTVSLFDNYHYKKSIVSNGKLTGTAFTINKLFNINDYNVQEAIEKAISLYGNDGLFIPYADNRLELNLSRIDLLDENLNPNLTEFINKLDDTLQTWLNKYSQYIVTESSNYTLVTQKYSQNQIQEAVFNQTLAYMDFDDLFEGGSNFYKDAQTFLKRDKEIQAGGQLYMGGVDLSDNISAPLHNINDSTGSPIEIEIFDRNKTKTTITTKNFDGSTTLMARNGFRAVTIANTVTTFDVAKDIYDKVYKQLIEVEHKSEEEARKIAKSIADGYGYSGTPTKVNDAQSYITLEEFIRRKWMDGTINEYGDLLDKLLDENYELTAEDYANINRKIQVQKNFYYDIAFDTKTGLYYPRQIKNAEFVLIPKFIKGSELEQLYNIMKENDINQINTVETSKAANVNTLEFWNNDGVANADKFEQSLKAIPEAIQTYYYRYLYKQQDVVDHIDNEENKAGIQILKKIQDNIIPGTNAWEAANKIQDLLVENIKEDYNRLLNECGWIVDENGKIVNENGSDDLNFKEFYRRAKEEAARLGMNSNFIDYITPDSNGRPVMPSFMNNVSNKLESIAQSIFNTSIIRQTLPGFHAVQVTNVGFSRKLNYKITDKGIVAEVMVAPWNDQIKELIAKYGKQGARERLEQIEADEFIGYRIPTEGKQSIVKFKVVDFLDESAGSTIIVPNEWVAQSGSDFDIDTIYSIVHELSLTKEKVSKKVKTTKKTAEGKDWEVEETIWEEEYTLALKNKGRAKRNNEILEAFKTILSDPSCFEENASRSNYDDLTAAKNTYDIERNLTTSVYDVFTEVRFMQNAIDGRKLKAFSVNRDTFASISNRIHGRLKKSIVVKYDLSKGFVTEDNIKAAYGEDGYSIDDNIITVYHNKLGWSQNNRNVVGKLITPYSSQTTAHILDAIKEGVVFNETDYTFGVFKTLIDLGVDYNTAVSFLAQAAITDLNNEYFKVNSVFTNSYKTIIENVYRDFAKRYGFTLNGEAIKDSASIDDILLAIGQNKDFVKKYENYWGLKNYNQIPAFEESKFAKNINDKINPYHYFGVLQMFNNLKGITEVIEDIAQVSRPDATGVKQTVRATRKLLDNAREYATDLSHDILITEDGDRFLNKLYGFDEHGNIHVEKSGYKYLAAMLKYGIETSVNINKKLFETSSDKFNAFVTNFELHIGRELTDDEYNDFKKYYVSSIYAGLEFINSPIKLNKFGDIVSYPNYGQYGPQFWETEQSRIFGYIEPAKNGDLFTVKDFANPNEDELNEYYLLTPLQKVLFLKKALPYDDNIFNKLYINKISDRNYKEKGYTNNKISININTYNIEDIYQEFANAFFNNNPLIRLAAADLIKYAFAVEGFNYKNGAIAKVIPNSVLYNKQNEFGLDIIETLNKMFINQLEKNDVYYDRFIRSHSEILTSINIPLPATNDKSFTFGNILNKYREKIKVVGKENAIEEQYSGLIEIPVSNETQDLLKYLKLSDADKTFKYIKINSSTEANKKKTNVLYKVIPTLGVNLETGKEYITNFTLIPLNLLEENEWAEDSINYNNNSFYTYKFYKETHPEVINPVDFIIPRYKRVIENTETRSSIEDNVAKEDGIAHELAVRAKEQILDWYNNRRTISGGANFGYIQLKGTLVNSVLGIDKNSTAKSTTQDIILDDLGTILTIQIVPAYDTANKIRKIRQNKKIRPTDYLKWFATENKNLYYSEADEDNLGIYRIIPINVIKKEKETTKNSEELFSVFDGLIDHINSMTNGIKHTEEATDMSALIMRELQYQKAHGNTGVADDLKLLSIKGFIPNDTESLETYKVDIYKIAAKYYRDKADAILKQLAMFSCDGELFDVSDDRLYNEALRNDPEQVNKLYRLILEASTFGNQVKGILDLQFVGEDKETTDNLLRIQRAITDVRNNNKIHKAFNNIYNIYLAKEYANNPNVRLGIVAMTDIFGDSEWFAANIGDVTHLNHKQIQVVTKLALEELEKGRIRGLNKVAEFEKWWNEMEAKIGSDELQKVLSKLIDNEGKFIQPYVKRFIEDKIAWKEKLDAVEQYGRSSIEYLKVKHARDKWYIDNTEEPYTKDYYQERWNNEDYILKTDPKAYSEYLALEQEYYNLGKFAMLDDTKKLRKRLLAEKMQDMRTNEILNGFLIKRADINDKYFEWVESEDFKKTVQKHKEILDAYHQNNPTMTMYDMYTNPDAKFDRYRDSYDWIKMNCIYTFDDDAKKQIFNAFAVLKKTNDRHKKGIIKVLNKIDPEQRFDSAGQIIGTLYTLEDAREIKRITEQKYDPFGRIDEDGNLVQSPYNENSEAYDSDANLIKIVPQTPIFKESLFIDYFLSDDERNPETRKLKRKYYTYINNIVKRGLTIDESGERVLSAEYLVKNCTPEELQKLATLYKELRIISKKATEQYEEDNSESSETKEKKPFVYKTNTPELLKQKKYIDSAPAEVRKVLEDIFYEHRKDGSIIYKKKIPVGNKYIYGYIDLKKNQFKEYTAEAKKYIDEEKTNARDLLDNNIEFAPTEYYYKAYRDAQAKGEDYFNEWYEANHVYNPYSHRDEPITIWTVMRAIPTGSLHANADYVANRDNLYRQARESYKTFDEQGNEIEKPVKNDNYNEYIGLAYNGSKEYANPIFNGLSDFEKEILTKLQDVAKEYAITNGQKNFLRQGFAPRVYEKETDFMDTLNDVANVFGLGKNTYLEKDWHTAVDFEHDFDADFSMYNLLKAKGYKTPPKRPVRAIQGETDEQYNKRLKDWEAEVKQIKADNLALDNAVFSRNWKEVYKRLIQEGNIYGAKAKMKDLLYLTLEDLRERDAYNLSNRNSWFGDLIKNKATSTTQKNSYYTIEQNRTADTFQNWVRRYLFDEYKKFSKGTKLADRVQTMNSAKFMMFNLMSGINNVTVGLVNMIMESNAGDYFTHGQLAKAMGQYGLNIRSMVNHFVTGETNNELVAIMELFSIEGYDRANRGFQDFKSNLIEKANDVAYGFLSSGEHFMQNSAMLAMLDSHKIYEDPNHKGKYVIGTKSDYLLGLEIAAIDETLKDFMKDNDEDSAFYKSLYDLFYNVYIPRIREDKKEAIKFDRLQKDIINDFIRSDIFKGTTKDQTVVRRKAFVDSYLEHKKAISEKYEEKFNGFESVREQLEFDADEGREKIRQGSHLTEDHIAELVVKAKSVNKKIHGVYDKLGAAKIERGALGGLIMQYKKHLYPGFMKHWRRRGYFNELRGTNEYGAIQSLLDWLFMDYRYKGTINKDIRQYDEQEEVKNSLGNIFLMFANNAMDLGINWRMLPDWQKHNVLRLASDLGGAMLSLLVIMAIYAFIDDDDLKDSVWANEVLYLADRLYGESTMYDAGVLNNGLWTEFSNFKDKPIVAMDYIYDGYKMWGYFKDYIADKWFGTGYNPNYTRGTYKGENKMWVTIRKNIPAYRQYQQIKHIDKNNNYYRVNENNSMQKLFKNLGKFASREENSGFGLINR